MPVTLDRPYTTVAAVGAECRDTAAANNDVYANAINLASRYIDSLTARDFLFHDYSTADLVVLEQWCAGDVIFFPWPIITFTELREMDISLDASMYAVTPAPFGRVERLPYFSGVEYILAEMGEPPSRNPAANTDLNRVYYLSDLARRRQVKVRGTFGYAPALDGGSNPDYTQPPPTLPAEIRRAATAISARWAGRYRKEAQALDGSKFSILEMEVPKEALIILRPYKRQILT